MHPFYSALNGADERIYPLPIVIVKTNMNSASVCVSAESDNPCHSDQLLPQVYEQLRQLAKRRIASEFNSQSLQATDLVHEAYLRLKKSGQDDGWNSLNHFFGAASIAMRRILVERARMRKAEKRGGGKSRQSLSQIELIELEMKKDDIDVLSLDEALERLGGRNARTAKLVELRFFLGMTIQEAADVLNVSTSTAELDWRYARSFLRIELTSFV